MIAPIAGCSCTVCGVTGVLCLASNRWGHGVVQHRAPQGLTCANGGARRHTPVGGGAVRMRTWELTPPSRASPQLPTLDWSSLRMLSSMLHSVLTSTPDRFRLRMLNWVLDAVPTPDWSSVRMRTSWDWSCLV